MAPLSTSFGAVSTITDELAATAARLQSVTVQVRGNRWGGGAGVIWRSNGLIVTNAHVVRGDRAEVELPDGRRFEGAVTARDRERDLAALQIDATGLPSATTGDSDALRPGQIVIALGHPLGFSDALAFGVIHRVAAAPSGGQAWVQADVRLAPGNSGGPLADCHGNVVGISSMVSGGLGLAVPSNAVNAFLTTSDQRPYIGVSVQAVAVPVDGHTVPGMLILDVAAGSPADGAGLLVGDVLVGAAGRLFRNPSDFVAALRESAPRSTVRLDTIRGGRRRICEVVLGTVARGTAEAA